MLLVLREQKPPARAHLVLNIRRNPSAKRFRSSLSGHSKSKFLPPLDDCRVRYKSEFFDVPAFRRTSDLMPTETPMTSFILRDDSNFTVDLFFLPFCQYSTFRPWSSQMVRGWALYEMRYPSEDGNFFTAIPDTNSKINFQTGSNSK